MEEEPRKQRTCLKGEGGVEWGGSGVIVGSVVTSAFGWWSARRGRGQKESRVAEREQRAREKSNASKQQKYTIRENIRER